VAVPRDRPEEEPVYHNFIVRHPQRDRLMEHLAKRGVGTRVHYPIPIHLQSARDRWATRRAIFRRPSSRPGPS